MDAAPRGRLLKKLKSAVVAGGTLVLLLACLIAYLVLTFDARTYEPQLVRLIHQKTGRTLKITGAFKLSLWPDIGVEVDDVHLSERNSGESFADADQVRLSVKLLPLLSGELVIHQINVQRAVIRIVRYEDGHFNVDDLLKSQGGASDFEIGAIAISRSSLEYVDHVTRRRYQLSGLDLTSGRVATTSIAPLALHFHLSGTGVSDANVALKGILGVDARNSTYTLHDSSFEIDGPGQNKSTWAANGKAHFEMRSAQNEFVASDITLRMTLAGAAEKMDAVIQAARLFAGGDRSGAENVRMQLQAKGGARVTQLQVVVPRFEGLGHDIRAENTTADLDSDGGRHKVRATVTARMRASMSERKIVLSDLKSMFHARTGVFGADPIEGSASGNLILDLAGEAVQVDLTGNVADSPLKARLSVSGFTAPVYRFNVDVDRLNLGGDSRNSPTQVNSTDIDLSPLSSFPASGTVRIRELRKGQMKANDVVFVITP